MKPNISISIFIIALFLIDFLYPQQSKLSKSVNHLSDYISANEFVILKKDLGDLSAIDSIYAEAISQTNYDYAEALLALTFATVPYREVPIQIPVLKSILNYPLISASDSIFNLKNRNLPKYVFFDSPSNDYGDKDKLAHFYGSAWISYSSNIFDLGNLIGYFVEVFEESFKVQSSVDERDLLTNQLGNAFGALLKKNKNILPSQIIILRTITNFHYNL